MDDSVVYKVGDKVVLLDGVNNGACDGFFCDYSGSDVSTEVLSKCVFDIIRVGCGGFTLKSECCTYLLSGMSTMWFRHASLDLSKVRESVIKELKLV